MNSIDRVSVTACVLLIFVVVEEMIHIANRQYTRTNERWCQNLRDGQCSSAASHVASDGDWILFPFHLFIVFPTLPADLENR